MQHLVPNPIYDGPLYDTVQPKFETLENSIFRNPTTKDEVEMNSEPYLIPTTGSHTKEPNTIRYVDQPQSLQSAFSASVVSNQTQTNGMVKEAAKDSGQCVENTSSVTENLKAPLESVDGCLNDPSPALLEQPSLQCLMGVEETYTQMNPSGTITFSLTGGLGEVTKN